MVAAATTLPVIGVPVPLKYLDGMDSLLSIVQMPAGCRSRPYRSAARAMPACWRCAFSCERSGLAKRMQEFQVQLRQTALDKGAALTDRLK